MISDLFTRNVQYSQVQLACRPQISMKNDIFDRFSSRRIFRVGEHFCEKKLKILDFLTFEGIVQCLALPGFGQISMSNFQWHAWGVLKINIFQGI